MKITTSRTMAGLVTCAYLTACHTAGIDAGANTAAPGTNMSAPAQHPLPGGASDEQQILAAVHSWLPAVQSGDRAKLEQLLHFSFVEISPTGKVSSRADALSVRPPPAGSSQTFENLTVRQFGDTAIVTGINRYRESANTAPHIFVFTDVLVRTSNRWQLVSSQATRR